MTEGFDWRLKFYLEEDYCWVNQEQVYSIECREK